MMPSESAFSAFLLDEDNEEWELKNEGWKTGTELILKEFIFKEFEWEAINTLSNLDE